MSRSRVVTAIGVLGAVAVLVGGCSRSSAGATREPGSRGSLTIGSGNSTEQVLLSYVYREALQHDGYEITMQDRMGPRQNLQASLADTAIDMYVDQGGAVLDDLAGGKLQAGGDASANLAAVRSLLGPRHVNVLAQAPASDSNVLAVSAATADRFHLRTISDLAAVGSQLSLGGPPDCPTEPLCLPGWESVYGLRFKAFRPFPQGEVMTAAALRAGAVDVAVLPSSSGTISHDGLVALQDDRRMQPPNRLTPMVRGLVDTPTLTRDIDNVSAHLTDVQLRQMNIEVNFGHKDPSDVASKWDEKEYLAAP